MQAYCAAVQAGISPVEFWELTPYLTRKAIAALTDGRNTQAWMIAALTRAKKMPKLNEMISKPKAGNPNMEADLKKALGMRKPKKELKT